MATDGCRHLVKAIYNFKGSNNDELNFTKGDVITVTQVVEGGWWEGTLKEVTGWFPSNYVKEYVLDSFRKSQQPVSKHTDFALSIHQENLELYREMVFCDIVESEANYIQELQNLMKRFLQSLQITDILNEKEFGTLLGNFDELVDCHATLLDELQGLRKKNTKDQRIGGVFMQSASHLKVAHLNYCANHPKAVSVIETHKNALCTFMEVHGAMAPGIQLLSSGLSQPFRRLEKYPGLLQELQRHTEGSHVDRGDVQRAISVYKELADSCTAMRRQKEMELEVLLGNIQGWEGEIASKLGEIINMGPVIIVTEAQDRKDRYFVLFPHTLVMLSVSPHMTTFNYEGKLPLSDIDISKLHSGNRIQNAFVITGKMIQRIIVLCHSRDSMEQWLQLIQQQISINQHPGGVSIPPSSSRGPKTHNNFFHISQLHITVSQDQANNLLPPQPPPPPRQIVVGSSCTRLINTSSVKKTPSQSVSSVERVWKMCSLKPHPPLQSCFALSAKENIVLRRAKAACKVKEAEEKHYEDDMKMLHVIEAYCNSAKARYKVNSVDLCHLMALRNHGECVSDQDTDDYANPSSRTTTWCCGTFAIKTVKKFL